MGKESGRHSFQRRCAGKHTKKALAIISHQSKSKTKPQRYHFTPTWMPIIKKTDNTKFCKEAEKSEISYTTDRNTKPHSHFKLPRKVTHSTIAQFRNSTPTSTP